MEVQGRKQSRVVSRLMQPGGWWYDLLTGGNGYKKVLGQVKDF